MLAFGAVLAVEPLGRPLLDAAHQYGFCGEGRLLREFGVSTGGVEDLVIEYYPVAGTSPEVPLTLRPRCDR